MRTIEVELEVPNGYQLVLGQAHFIKTLEDVYETLIASMPQIRFGVAFCEASGKALVRSEGTDPKCTEIAQRFASLLASGHTFVVVLEGSYPINVLNRLKMLDEVASVFCATSNKVVVVLAEVNSGRGVLGVVDGTASRDLETDADREERRKFLRTIGYKK